MSLPRLAASTGPSLSNRDPTFHDPTHQEDAFLAFFTFVLNVDTRLTREGRKSSAGEHARYGPSDDITRRPVLVSILFLACDAIAPLADSIVVTPGHHAEVGVGLLTRKS